MSDNNTLKLSVITASALLLTGLVIKYHDRAIFDEHNKGSKAKDGLPLIGSITDILREKEYIHELHLNALKKHDTLTLSWSALGLPHTVNTIDPANVEHILKNNFENYVKGPRALDVSRDLLGHGIFNANGEQWRWQRKSASLIFNVKNFRDHFTDVFIDEIKIMTDIFDEKIKKDEIIDIHDMMFRFTLDSFVLLGYGINIGSIKSKEKVPFAHSFDELQLHTLEKFVNPFVGINQLMKRIFQPNELTPKQHMKVIDNFATQVIHERREKNKKGTKEEENDDLLAHFMNAKNEFKEPLSDQQLRDTIMNFIIAGRDTTAQALSWTFYLLMLHPDVEERLLNEIHQFITDDAILSNSTNFYNVIKNMVYAHAVFYEVLRLYPSVPANQRYALKDDIWPDGTHIRKGDYVMWNSYAMGRSEKVWGSDATQFKPERWINADGNLIRESQGKWPAFHAGPRVCLGQNLATLEALVALITLLKKYKFHLVPNQEIRYQVSLTLPMKYGLKVNLQHR
ncbi:unnamed protein product [Cunninghamella blakesleeana]